MSDKSIFMQEDGMPWVPEVGEIVIYHGVWRDRRECKMLCFGYRLEKDNYLGDYHLRIVLSEIEDEKSRHKVFCRLKDISKVSLKKDSDSKSGAL